MTSSTKIIYTIEIASNPCQFMELYPQTLTEMYFSIDTVGGMTTQTFDPVEDSLENDTCGDKKYTVIDSGITDLVTVDGAQRKIIVQTDDPTKEGAHPFALRVTLEDYPDLDSTIFTYIDFMVIVEAPCWDEDISFSLLPTILIQYCEEGTSQDF